MIAAREAVGLPPADAEVDCTEEEDECIVWSPTRPGSGLARGRVRVRVRLRLRVRFGTAATSPTRQRWSASPEASQCDAVTGAALAVIVKGESITQAPCTPRSAPRTCTLYAPQTEMQNSTNTAPSARSRSEGVTFCLPRKVTWGELMT